MAWTRNHYLRELRVVKSERALPGTVVQMGGAYYIITPSGGWRRATPEQVQHEAHLIAVAQAAKIAAEEPICT